MKILINNITKSLYLLKVIVILHHDNNKVCRLPLDQSERQKK
jgi:hypothetical protein